MMAIRFLWIMCLLSGLGACATQSLPAISSTSHYVALSPGIFYRQIATPAPNPRVTQVIQIDLSRGGFQLRLTPGDTRGGKEYRSLTTTSYTRLTGAIIAVNAGYFGPVVDAEGVAMDAAGFVVAAGVITHGNRLKEITVTTARL